MGKSEDFIFEENHLKNTVDKLEHFFANIYDFAPYPKRRHYDVVSDNDSSVIKQVLFEKASNQDFLDKKAPLKEAIPSPYFGRIDLVAEDNENEVLSYYIGKMLVSFDLSEREPLVFNWATPSGRFFYQKSQFVFEIDHKKYRLMLRRNFDISNKVLNTMNDEYAYGQELFENKVTDPFLLDILKRKKKAKRLTDIIATIQEIQYKIITAPSAETFIVQGCAGSGKTMILLHRLSYFVLNNPGSSFKATRIITPNDNFFGFISPLMKDLGITKIKTHSIENYYLSILNERYGETVTFNDKNSEIILNKSFLEEVYSRAFFRSMISEASNFVQSLYENLHFDELLPVVKQRTQFNYNKESVTIGNITTLKELVKQSSKSIEKYLDDHAKQIKDNKTDLIKIIKKLFPAQDISSIETKVDSLKLSFQADLQTLAEQLKTISSEINYSNSGKTKKDNSTSVGELKLKASSLLTRLLEIEAKLNKNTVQITKLELEQKNLRQTAQKAIDWNNNEKEKDILHKKEIEIQLEKAFFLNFLLKTTLKNELEEIKERISSMEKQFNDFNQKNTRLEKELVDLKKAQEKAAVQEISLEKLERNKTLLTNIESRLDDHLLFIIFEDELSEYLQATLQMEILNKAQAVLKPISENYLFEQTAGKLLKQMYEKYEVKTGNKNYKFKLYAKILFNTIFKDPPKLRDLYLHIDEAQDLSETELEVINLVNGGEVRFNLYGDVHQSIYSKGISDWGVLKRYSSKVYTLDNNYRNTNQMVAFYNKELKLRDLPVGLDGDPVSKVTLDEAKGLISSWQKSHQNFAILYKNEESGIRNYFALRKIPFSIQENLPFALTIEEAKGMEFENVLVFTDGMTPNEKYVGFTRGLSTLTVCDDKFESMEI